MKLDAKRDANFSFLQTLEFLIIRCLNMNTEKI